MAKPDWNAIRAEYITTTISYRDLAEKWGVSFRTLADRAKRENWRDGRNTHHNTVVKKTVQRVADKASKDTAKQLIKLQKAADSMASVIDEIFTDKEQFKRHIITTGLGRGETRVDCRVEEKYDTKAIKDLTGALKDLALVMRNIYDLPTVAEQSAMELAAQRLELEKAKADVGRLDDEETGVVEITPVLEDKDNE
ncbi:MAG: hypothetical protein RR365_06470 [Bacteroides sp.]